MRAQVAEAYAFVTTALRQASCVTQAKAIVPTEAGHQHQARNRPKDSNIKQLFYMQSGKVNRLFELIVEPTVKPSPCFTAIPSIIAQPQQHSLSAQTRIKLCVGYQLKF